MCSFKDKFPCLWESSKHVGGTVCYSWATSVLIHTHRETMCLEVNIFNVFVFIKA